METNDVNVKTKVIETLTIEDTLESFQTNKKKGLTKEEAEIRSLKYGKNKLDEKKKKGWFMIFLEQMNNPMVFVLFAAVILTIGISIIDTISYMETHDKFSFTEAGDWPDVVIILAIVILNAVIGTIQEVKAQTSLEALKKMSSPESLVIRSGERIKVKSEDLTLGDIVILEEGDNVGADLRLIESHNLKANESSLTGESLPIEKDAKFTFTAEVPVGDRCNMVYMSTPIVYGRGMGVVVKTGMNTEIGRIASALDVAEEMTPLQKTLAKLSKTLGLLTLFVVIAVLIADIIWILIDGRVGSVDAWIEAVLSSIALAVAAIPEGLAAFVTIILSIGVQRMVKANTIVRKLASVETLGAVSVVCSDKTGTLTQNKMTVKEAMVNFQNFTYDEFNEENKNNELRMLSRGMSLCSNATVDEGEFGDPTEIALVAFANNFNMHKGDLQEETPRIDELPFDSVRKMMSTMHQVDNNKIMYTKGALDSILLHTTRILVDGEVRDITKEDIEKIYVANKEFAAKALRVLALAYNDEKDEISEEELVFVGLVAMIDPARKEAAPAVTMLKSAGIITVMITGDHVDTAYAIAKDLGIVDSRENCREGREIDDLSLEELQEICKTVRVFARVSPENKVSIVKAFKANGNICAMTGDGVNDAPSLKAADIGIAMGITGTDVSKGASDMVLVDDNFASIEKAVEEGRGIYSNIKKTVIFLISCNIAEVLVMFAIICLGLPSPLLAIHLLWINLVTDSLPCIALGMDPKDPSNMLQKPRDPSEGFFAKEGVKTTAIYGAVVSIGVFIGYLSCAWLHGIFSINGIKEFYETNPDMLSQAQTMAFLTLAFCELTHMFNMSNLNKSFIFVFKGKNKMMFAAFIIGVALQLFVIEIPGVRNVFSTSNLTWSEWLITLAISVLPLLVHELIVFFKWIKRKISEKKAKTESNIN